MPTLQITLSNDDRDALIGALAYQYNVATGQLYNSVGELTLGVLTNALRDIRARANATAVATARTNLTTAQGAFDEAVAPSLSGGLQFDIAATTPGLIAASSTGTSTVTFAVADPVYSGYTITFSLLDLTASGITGSFSPATRTTAGTTTCTITIPAIAAGTYRVQIIGTDAAGLSNSIAITLTVV